MRASGLLLVSCAALGLALCGCGGSRGGKVTGTVLHDGKALADADVQFVPADDPKLGTNGAVTGPDGKFQVKPDARTGKTLAPGKYHVYVTKYVQKDGTVPKGEDADQLRSSGQLRNVVHERYNYDPESDRGPAITVEIKGGDQELAPFQLKK